MVWSPLAGGLLSGKFGPGSAAPKDARRANFSPAWFVTVGAHAALSLLLKQNGEALEKHCLSLAQAFREDAPEYGLSLAPHELPSHIIGVRLRDPGAASKVLKDRRIMTSVRKPYLRLGFHGFNTPEEVDRTLQAISLIEREE